MDSFPRNTPALMARIDQLRNSLLKRFENLIELAAPDKTDRNTTALTVYQQQIETAALIRTTEDITTLIRQMMEAWKFGHLKTIDQSSDLQTRTDEDAKEDWDIKSSKLPISLHNITTITTEIDRMLKMSASSTPPLTLIVAATVKNGIGKNGTLPWPMLKKEMAYFARVTKRVPSSLNSADATTTSSSSSTAPIQNVVVMGRKTWDSIPPKFRPLPQRTNLVISRQENIDSITPQQMASGDVLVAKDIASGLAALSARAKEGKAKTLGRVFVIGGGAIYKAALAMEEARHVLLTRVQGEWDCDTQFPDLDGDERWVRREKSELEEFVEENLGESAVLEEEVKGEKYRFEFMLYEKK
ncbi:dihydrofolate reductase-like domain-containing protein [Delphinella strobiligena]|nr:dihydrofolate reductase-like domain-containing protein [Delphinella strobiligena]